MNKQEKKSRVLDYILQNPQITSNSKLARFILSKEKNLDLTETSLRALVGRLRKNGIEEGEKVKIKAKKAENKYSVLDNEYHFFAEKGEFQLPVEFVDQLFYEYSEKGLNLSQTQMINKHNIEVWQWTCIKTALWLYKKAHIFSPYTVKNTPKDQLDEMFQEKMDALLNNTGFQVEDKYNKAVVKKYREVINKQAERDFQVQSLLLELSDLIPVAQIQPVVRRVKDSNNNDVICVHIFDIHFGAESRLNSTLPEYSPAITRTYLDKIADIVNKQQASKVHIFFGGDYIESFSGTNHPDAWKGVAKSFIGANLVVQCYQAFVEFISKIDNVTNIYGVSGNHDRAASDKKLESEGYIGQLIFEFIKLSFPQIDIKYDEKIIASEIDGIQYIMSHGDKKFSDLPAAELILEYGKQGKYNLLTSGHWHERRIKADTKNFRQVVCPSLFPGNDYSVNLGYSTLPGFLITKNNGTGKPIVQDYPL